MAPCTGLRYGLQTDIEDKLLWEKIWSILIRSIKIENMKIIKTEKMPAVKGHYSPVIEHGGILYLSGQIPVDPEKGAVPDTIEEQTRLVLSKIDLLLRESGSSLNQVLQVRIFVTDISLWDQVNKVYADFFKDHKPARCVVPVGKLHYGCLLEVEATAFI
jgi:reactive intermediate/imine deaminase